MTRRFRRLRMGAATLLGSPMGFFSPYRYAATVRSPKAYPELEAVFREAEPRMMEVFAAIESYGERLAGFAGPPPEPRWDQSWFPRLDGAAAYALVRNLPPARIVEVGSGHSTRVLARAVADAGTEAQFTCIDPQPRATLPPGVDHQSAVLSPASLPLFDALGPGDIAFFDSSHLLWPGSDVDLLCNRVLPRLASGVRVHIHDVFLPDPYPEAWAWRGYTEQLGLGGWLAGGAVRVLFSSRYALTRMGAAARPGVAQLPLPDGAFETSLWLERI